MLQDSATQVLELQFISHIYTPLVVKAKDFLFLTQ